MWIEFVDESSRKWVDLGFLEGEKYHSTTVSLETDFFLQPKNGNVGRGRRMMEGEEECLGEGKVFH